MVNQGDIIKINFDPRLGHEQAGYRPALVVSNDAFNSRTHFAIVCPITNTNNGFPLHIPLDGRTATTGVVLCEHIRSLDLGSRVHTVVEQIPQDLLQTVVDTISAELEII